MQWDHVWSSGWLQTTRVTVASSNPIKTIVYLSKLRI